MFSLFYVSLASIFLGIITAINQGPNSSSPLEQLCLPWLLYFPSFHHAERLSGPPEQSEPVRGRL